MHQVKVLNARSGRGERLPYSLSRWTDLPKAKWAWFREQLAQGSMVAFHPREMTPSRWSLWPEDVLGLIFWTKHARNLVIDHPLLAGYSSVIHVTLTGWTEVEKGAPSVDESTYWFREAVRLFGANRVFWRFCPIPILPLADVLTRFRTIASKLAEVGVSKVYVVFLQTNDRMPEVRSQAERVQVLCALVAAGTRFGIEVLLCRDDDTLVGFEGVLPVRYGICDEASTFGEVVQGCTEDCGCSLAVDPFTINESCCCNCRYCYAADKSLAPQKRNTV